MGKINILNDAGTNKLTLEFNGTSDDTLNVGDVAALQSTPRGRRNLIINGDFQVSQRGDYTGGYTGAGVVYLVDRWNFNHVNISGNYTTDTHKKDQVVNGITTNTMRIEATADTNKTAIAQQIEDYKVFRGRTSTVSFWYKSNTVTEWNWWDGVSQTHYTLPNTSGGWTYYTQQVTVADNNTNARVEFYQNSTQLNAGEYIEVAMVQCELGSVATPFEHRSYGEELMLCQRYYQRLDGQWENGSAAGDRGIVHGHAWGATNFYWVHHFMTPMRAGPSLIMSSGFGGSWFSGGTISATNNFVLQNSNKMRAELACTIQAAVGQGNSGWFRLNDGHWIAFDSEL